MSRVEVAVIAGLAMAAVSCATVKPGSLWELQELTADSRAASAKAESPVSWEEGMRYLAAAEEAFRGGDAAQADRMAELGLVQTKIAIAGADQAKARKRLEAAVENKRNVAEEIERVRVEIEKLETERERRAVRKHLEGVVDATRLRAAAAEEIREGRLGGEDKRRLDDARRRIGGQMMSRIVVWRDVLSSLMSAGVVPEGRVALVDGEIEAAKRGLADLDLASMQEHIERAGVEIRRLVNGAWDGKEKEREAKSEKISALLSKSRFKVIEEDLGEVVLVEAPLSKNGRAGARARDALGDLGAALKEAGRYSLLIVTSVDDARKDKAELLSDKLAQEVVEVFSSAGFTAANIVVRACGSNTPLQAQKGAKSSVAVVLIPLP